MARWARAPRAALVVAVLFAGCEGATDSPDGGDAGLLVDADEDAVDGGAFVDADVGAEVDSGAVPDAAASDAAPPDVGSLLGFVRISAGMFTMGSPVDELGRAFDETQHSVTITRDFWLKETEVTQAEWRSIVGVASPTYDANCGDACPVGGVSWYDALEYVNRLSDFEGIERCYVLSQCSGVPGVDLSCGTTRASSTFKGLDCRGYRLPTEGEWEYSIRAGTTTAFYTGEITQLECDPIDLNLDTAGWYCGNHNGALPTMVREKASNAWGLFDMSGGVAEWVNDGYSLDYGPEAEVDPIGEAGRDAVIRGGGFPSFAKDCRSAARSPFSDVAPGGVNPDQRLRLFGLRPARTVR